MPLSRDVQVFAVFLAVAGSLASAVGYAAWQRAPGDGLGVEDLPSRVVQVAFGVDELDLTQPVDTAPPPVQARVTVGDLSFLGSGDWVLASAIIQKHAHELGVCYAEQPMVEDALEVSVAGGRATPSQGLADTDCVLAVLDGWSWPRDLTGTIRLTLVPGTVI